MLGRMAMVVAATAAGLWCSTGGATEGSIELTAPVSGAVVHAQVPQLEVSLPAGFASADYLSVVLDGRRLAQTRTFNVTDSALPPETGLVTGPLHDLRFLARPAGVERLAIPLDPNLQAFAAGELPGPLGTGYVRPNQRLRPTGPIGYLAAGSHTVTVEAYRFGLSGDALTGAVSASFTMSTPRMSLVYETGFTGQRILTSVGANFGPNRGGFAVQAGAPRSFYGVTKLSGASLATRSSDEIAGALAGAVDRACGKKTRNSRAPAFCRGSGMVVIDEIGAPYVDWTPAEVAGRGRPSPGQRLAEAMQILRRRTPWTFTYASRIHIYASPSTTASLGNPDSTDDFQQVAPALAAAGGVWLEMYKGSAGFGARADTAAEWRAIPANANRLIKSAGGSTSRLHFVITRARSVESARAPAGTPCTTPMSCQWALASETPLGRTIVENGVGAYRTSDQATEWLDELLARTPD